MKGIDTNILVRFLVGDDELQAQKVYKIFKKAESSKNELYVPKRHRATTRDCPYEKSNAR